MTDQDAEQRAELAGSALAYIEDAFLVESPDFDDAEHSLEEWYTLATFAERLSTAARAFKKHCHNQIAQELGVGTRTGIRIGDDFVREGKGGKWKVKDPSGLMDWIAWHQAWDLINLKADGAVTVTRFKEWFTRPDEDGQSLSAHNKKIMQEAAKIMVKDYFTYETDNSPITITPISKASEAAKKLEHGERYVPKQPKRLEGNG